MQKVVPALACSIVIFLLNLRNAQRGKHQCMWQHEKATLDIGLHFVMPNMTMVCRKGGCKVVLLEPTVLL